MSTPVESKFIIVGTQRTGSSFVATSIEQHPDIACGWEWTLDLPPHKRTDAVKRALNWDFSGLSTKCQGHMTSFPRSKKMIGFRWLFSSSPLWIGSPSLSPSRYIERITSYKRILEQDRSIKVIHITRNDDIGWLVSLFAAKKTGAFIGKQHEDNLKVHIPLKNARKRIVAKRNLDAALEDISNKNPYMKIDYADIENYPNSAFDKIYNFLDVTAGFRPSFTTQKQQVKQYPEIVENFEKLNSLIASL